MVGLLFGNRRVDFGACVFRRFEDCNDKVVSGKEMGWEGLVMGMGMKCRSSVGRAGKIV